jgi:DNA-binding NarL/FixJ family response regulator
MAAKAMIERFAEFRHVGEAASGDEALAILPTVAPDVILLDVEMPGMGGAELARRLTVALPEARLLAWTVSEASDDLIRMFRAGCSGYVLKDCGPEEMHRALLAALRDDAPVPRKMLPAVLRRVGLVSPPASRAAVHLTSRESEVLHLLARGAARKQIATSLGISVASVDSHVKSLYRKLNVSSQTEAVNAGIRSGLVLVDEL